MTFALILWLTAVGAQSQPLAGTVVDASGAAIQGALVEVDAPAGRLTAVTGADGAWTIGGAQFPPRVIVQVSASGFATIRETIGGTSTHARIVLQPQGIVERVTVSPESGRLAVNASATTLGAASIAASPALTLDDQLRYTPGFSLFRRTSSRVANPTTQGVTLRGLSASGASRTLVLADGVPLNDPFGGWVYWDRIPLAAIDRVDVVRGGSSDLHGDEALGGVIRIESRATPGFDARFDAGAAGTARASGYGAARSGRWTAGAAGESFTTDGYVVVAPEARGPVDVRADSSSRSGIAWVQSLFSGVTTDARGQYFTERRGNGTPQQVNATIVRQVTASARGAGLGGTWRVHLDAGSQNYRQTFTAVNTARTSERLTTAQWVGTDSGGVSVDWLRGTGRASWLVGGSARAVRTNLDEQTFSVAGLASPVRRTPAGQRNTGIVVQVDVPAGSRLTIESGARVEAWTADRRDDPSAHQRILFFEPRLTASLAVADGVSLRGAWLSGFRTPTVNELYRAFRVGNITTLANSALSAERSHGPEGALTVRRGAWTMRATGYATWLDGAVYNRTLSLVPTITRQRSNGDARAFGAEIELDARIGRALTATTGWSLTRARFTSGELDGRRVPQVPTAQGSLGLTASRGAGTAAIAWRYVGAQFDDDLNVFALRAGSVLDGRAGWRRPGRVEWFVAAENLLNADLDTGRTPIRTVGQPRTWRVGVVVR